MAKDEIEEHYEWDDDLFEDEFEEDKKPKKQNKKKKKKPINFNYIVVVIAFAALIMYSVYVVYFEGSGSSEPVVSDDVVLTIEGKDITQQQVDRRYDLLFFLQGYPDSFRDVITKQVFINTSLINEELLLLEARKEGITLAADEAEKSIEQLLEANDITEQEFRQDLAANNIDMQDMLDFFERRGTIDIFLSQEITPLVNITDKEIEAFYDDNSALFGDLELTDELQEQIRDMLFLDKSHNLTSKYLEGLRNDADIVWDMKEEKISTVPSSDSSPANEFTSTGDELCESDGLPIVRLYTASKDSHSSFIAPIFADIEKEYDNIVFYSWQIDTGDNLLTPEKETALPKSEVEIFREYNSQGAVPAVIVGCQYVRIGNAFEGNDNLESQELKEAIENVV